jgi:hypothetical protein
VSFNGAPVPFGYDAARKVLKVQGLQNVTQGGAWKQDWSLKWA